MNNTITKCRLFDSVKVIKLVQEIITLFKLLLNNKILEFISNEVEVFLSMLVILPQDCTLTL